MNDYAQTRRWFRMPAHGKRDEEFSLSRALLYQWRSEGLIRTRTIKAHGAVRGVTFVDRASVIALIEGSEGNEDNLKQHNQKYNV